MLPKWLSEKFSQLYSETKEEEFRFKKAMEVLGGKEAFVGLILSRFYRAGWMEKRVDEKDRRIKYYKLKNPNEIFKMIGKTKR